MSCRRQDKERGIENDHLTPSYVVKDRVVAVVGTGEERGQKAGGVWSPCKGRLLLIQIQANQTGMPCTPVCFSHESCKPVCMADCRTPVCMQACSFSIGLSTLQAATILCYEGCRCKWHGQTPASQSCQHLNALRCKQPGFSCFHAPSYAFSCLACAICDAVCLCSAHSDPKQVQMLIVNRSLDCTCTWRLLPQFCLPPLALSG